MTTYVITLSRTFPGTHPRKGEQTLFVAKLVEMLKWNPDNPILGGKLHTIRGNFPLWEKRFKKIEKGEACLSLRYWSEKPYRSKQVEFARLTREDGIGLQKIYISRTREPMDENIISFGAQTDERQVKLWTLANNDGLTGIDFINWFNPHFNDAEKRYPELAEVAKSITKEFAVIHFTNYRY